MKTCLEGSVQILWDWVDCPRLCRLLIAFHQRRHLLENGHGASCVGQGHHLVQSFCRIHHIEMAWYWYLCSVRFVQ